MALPRVIGVWLRFRHRRAHRHGCGCPLRLIWGVGPIGPGVDVAHDVRDEVAQALEALDPSRPASDRLIGFGDSPLYMGLDATQLMYCVEETLAALEPDWDGQPADKA